MKKTYLLLVLLCAVVGNVFGQKNADLEIMPCLIGNTQTSKHQIATGEKLLFSGDGGLVSTWWFTWRVKNLGPDTLKSGDSLAFQTPVGKRIYYYGATSNPTEKDSTIGIIPISGAGGPQIGLELMPPAAQAVSETITYNWCDSVYAKTGSVAHTDPKANNKICTSVQITYWLTGVNTVTYNADGFVLFPNPASGKLNVKFDFNGGAKDVAVALRNVIGQVVYSQDFGNRSGIFTHSIDIGGFAPGMYTAELDYNGEKIVSKVSIR